MREIKISQADIIAAMPGGSMPFSAACNIAIATCFRNVGAKYKVSGLFGLAEPKLVPPYEAWRDPTTNTVSVYLFVSDADALALAEERVVEPPRRRCQ